MKLSSIIDRPIRILTDGSEELSIHDLNTDEKLGVLILTFKGTAELYDPDSNFFEDDLE